MVLWCLQHDNLLCLSQCKTCWTMTLDNVTLKMNLVGMSNSMVLGQVQRPITYFKRSKGQLHGPWCKQPLHKAFPLPPHDSNCMLNIFLPLSFIDCKFSWCMLQKCTKTLQTMLSSSPSSFSLYPLVLSISICARHSSIATFLIWPQVAEWQVG